MMNKWALRKALNIIILSIGVILVLSTWGPPLMNINGYYFPEIIIVLFTIFLFLRRRHIYLTLRRCVFSELGIMSASWLLVIASLGMLRTGSFIGPYSELRSSLVLVFSFIFMYRYAVIQQLNLGHLLLWISFSVLCLDALLIVLQILIPGFLSLPASIDMVESQGEGGVFGFGRVSIPAINILVSAYLSSRTNRIFMLLFILLLGGILSLGGHRVILLTTVISTLFVPLCVFKILFSKKLKNKWIKVAKISFYLCLLVIFFQSDIILNYLSNASGIQYRLFTRTINTIFGVSSGLSGRGTVDFGEEGLRAAYFSFLIEESPSLLMPHGLGSREVYGEFGNEFDKIAKRFGASGESGNTHDLTILYLAYHHGLLITGFLYIVAVLMIYRRLKFARSGIDRAYVITALVGFLAIDLATAPVPGINIALVYGMFLGLLVNKQSSRRLQPHFSLSDFRAQVQSFQKRKTLVIQEV